MSRIKEYIHHKTSIDIASIAILVALVANKKLIQLNTKKQLSITFPFQKYMNIKNIKAQSQQLMEGAACSLAGEWAFSHLYWQ